MDYFRQGHRADIIKRPLKPILETPEYHIGVRTTKTHELVPKLLALTTECMLC